MDTNTFPKKSTVTDPVCGMEIDAASAAGESEHAGESYFFCSASCRRSSTATPRNTWAAPRSRSCRRRLMTAGGTPAARTPRRPRPRSRTRSAAWTSTRARRPAPSSSQGKTYCFCSKGCLEKFRADPARYLSQGPAGMAHEHERRDAPGRDALHLPDAPGDRPGQAREAARSAAWRSSRCVPTADDGPNPELIDMTRRFWVCLVLTVPLLVLAMGEMVAGPATSSFSGHASLWVQLALATPGRALGRAGRSSSAAGPRSSTATSTCSR